MLLGSPGKLLGSTEEHFSHNFYQNGLPGEAECSRLPQIHNSPSSTREERPDNIFGPWLCHQGQLTVSELSGLLAEDAMDPLGRAVAADRVGGLQRM